MSAGVTDEALLNYLATMERSRQEQAKEMYRRLTRRERRILREAAVMGFVLGTWSGIKPGNGRDMPPDSKIVELVLNSCQSQKDLYPLLGRLLHVKP